MRLWHYKFLDCLDDFHIVAQYRELLAIKNAIDKNGTPNHRLVNKVLNYPISDFKNYFLSVLEEFRKREIKYSIKKMIEIYDWKSNDFKKCYDNDEIHIYPYEEWHNDRYLTQCYYNLQEKFDCGIVSEKAWARIDAKYHKEIKDTKNENNKSGN